jgi:hypothetical protein
MGKASGASMVSLLSRVKRIYILCIFGIKMSSKSDSIIKGVLSEEPIDSWEGFAQHETLT